jgi:hypothetical protein
MAPLAPPPSCRPTRRVAALAAGLAAAAEVEPPPSPGAAASELYATSLSYRHACSAIPGILPPAVPNLQHVTCCSAGQPIASNSTAARKRVRRPI